MMPKRKKPSPEDEERARQILEATAGQQARIAAGEEPRRPGIRGAAGQPKKDDPDET